MRIDARQQRGFTLVEVIVAAIVLTIAIGGAASLAVGTFHSQAKAKLRQQQLGIAEQTLERIQADQRWSIECDGRDGTYMEDKTQIVDGCPIEGYENASYKIDGDTTFTVTARAYPVDSCGDNSPHKSDYSCFLNDEWGTNRDFDDARADYYRLVITVKMESETIQLPDFTYSATVNSTMQKVTGSMRIHICRMDRQIDERMAVSQCNGSGLGTKTTPGTNLPLSLPGSFASDLDEFDENGEYDGICPTLECVTYAAAGRFIADQGVANIGKPGEPESGWGDAALGVNAWWLPRVKPRPVSVEYEWQGPGVVRTDSAGNHRFELLDTPRDDGEFPNVGGGQTWGPSKWEDADTTTRGEAIVRGLQPGVYKVRVKEESLQNFAIWESHSVPGMQWDSGQKVTYVTVDAGKESSVTTVLRQKPDPEGFFIQFRTRNITVPWSPITVRGPLENQVVQMIPAPSGRVTMNTNDWRAVVNDKKGQAFSQDAAGYAYDWKASSRLSVKMTDVEPGLYSPKLRDLDGRDLWLYPRIDNDLPQRTDADDDDAPGRFSENYSAFDLVWVGGKHWPRHWAGQISQNPAFRPRPEDCTADDGKGPTLFCSEGEDGRKTLEARCEFCDEEERNKISASAGCRPYQQWVDYWEDEWVPARWVLSNVPLPPHGSQWGHDHRPMSQWPNNPGPGKHWWIIPGHYEQVNRPRRHWFTRCPASRGSRWNPNDEWLPRPYDLTTDPANIAGFMAPADRGDWRVPPCPTKGRTTYISGNNGL